MVLFGINVDIRRWCVPGGGGERGEGGLVVMVLVGVGVGLAGTSLYY